MPPIDIARLIGSRPNMVFYKISLVLFCFLWVRATFPRYRYDQLMRLGWKVFLPLSLAVGSNTAGVLVAFDIVPTPLSG